LIAQTLLIQETLTNEEIVSLYKTGYLPGHEAKVEEETSQTPATEVVEAEIVENNDLPKNN